MTELLDYFSALSVKKQCEIFSQLKEAGMSNYNDLRIFKNSWEYRFEISFYKGKRKHVFYIYYDDYVKNNAYSELKKLFNGDYKIVGFAYANGMKRLLQKENA